MLKFSANIIYLFNEIDLIDRIKAAANAGFQAVECQRPYEIPAFTLRDMLHEHQIEMVLINTPVSPDWPTRKGIAIFPECVDAFQEITETAIKYAAKIGCSRVHVVAGHIPDDLNWQRAEETFLSNLTWSANLGQQNGIKILIEPLNAIDNPGYFLTTTIQAVKLLRQANHDNLYLQYDLYHAGMNGENVIKGARDYFRLIEHMQMAGVPGRHEPDTGNIDMMTAFTAIDKMGYSGWIGAEYVPRNSTSNSFNWGQRYGIS